jgi:peptidyl-prolyl cis-trans isomerase B (cyclophilin B)
MRRILIAVFGIAALGLLAACSSSSTSAKNTPVQTQKPTTKASTPARTAAPTSAATTTPQGGTPMAFADACKKTGEKTFSSAPPMIIDPSKTYVATIKTDKGDIVVQIDTRHKVTANNFIFLACKGFYDGLTFHRVEKTPQPFVIQGGDPLGNGMGGPGYTIPGEFDGSNFVRGVIGMARSSDPNSGGSQFYIMIGDAHSLDGQYADFGKVTSGMDAADNIAKADKINAITIAEQ